MKFCYGLSRVFASHEDHENCFLSKFWYCFCTNICTNKKLDKYLKKNSHLFIKPRAYKNFREIRPSKAFSRISMSLLLSILKM